MSTVPWRLVGALAALVLLITVPAMLVRSCVKHRSQAAQSRVNDAQGAAFQNSASDAVNTQGTVNQRTTASDATTRSNERDIRNAQGANDAVNPAVRDSGFASLCKRPSFANSPSGKLHCAAPR